MVTTALFGSGVSYISKIPGIKEITEKIVTGEHVGRAADSIYYINQGQNYLKHHVNENLALIDYVKNDIQSFYSRLQVAHETNYEDIYYVIRQIRDSFYFEFENPAINSLVEKLQSIENFSGDRLQKIVDETIKYIQSLVWQMISYRNFTLDQFDIIPKLIDELNLSNIISLNHDLVLETYLQNKGIDYDDGFKFVHYKHPQWTGFDNTNSKLKLYKLHGSVNWFEVGVLKPQRSNEILKLPNDIYIQAVHNEDEAYWGTTDGTPKLLIGTFNKMLGYLSGIFETLYDAFKVKLKESNILIISGYGFADKGINTQLSYWLNHKSSNKMIIIHPYKDELIQKSRGNFRLNLMNENSKHPKVELIEKKFEEVTIEEILESISR